MVEGGTDGAGEGAGREPPHCLWHPSRQAVAVCVSCGRPICPECVRRYGYAHYCPYCYGQAPAPAFHPVPPPPPQPYGAVPDERDRRWLRANWTLKEAALALLLVFGVYYLVSLVVAITTGEMYPSSFLVYAFLFCPLIAVTVWFVAHRRQRGWRELGFKWGNMGRILAYGGARGATAAAASSVAMLFVVLLYYLITGGPPPSIESEQAAGGGAVALAIVVAVVLAPVFEEIFFRGFFYPPLRNRLGPMRAVILDGVIFGALHMRPESILSLVIVGIILAYVYEKTESILAPILAHALYNGLVVLISLLMGWPLF